MLALGLVTLHVLKGLKNVGRECDVFAISEAPVVELPPAFMESVRVSRKLLILEEHSLRGGIGEMITYQLAKLGVHYQLFHRHALGYPNKKYGSQNYHQQQSGLDVISITGLLREIL